MVLSIPIPLIPLPTREFVRYQEGGGEWALDRAQTVVQRSGLGQVEWLVFHMGLGTMLSSERLYPLSVLGER